MISVAMATYNGERYIVEQLESIRKQTRKVDEIIIVDDCSTDDTAVVIDKYRNEHSECNIQFYINEKNLGYRGNFKKSLSLCQGEQIFLCDQDDIWFENKVEVMCDILGAHPKAGVLSSAFIQIDGEGKAESDSKNAYGRRMEQGELVSVPLDDLIFHNISQGCSMVIQKEVKDIFLTYYDSAIPHDRALNIIAALSKNCIFFNNPLFYYRIHANNTIGLSDNMTLEKKNTLETRAFDAREAIKVLEFIERVDSVFYHENLHLGKMKAFSVNHVDYLEHKKLFRIVFQNFNSYYRRLKTFRGRMLDIYFVLKK